MTPDSNDDDDRTVIRPPGASIPPPAPAAADAKTMAVGPRTQVAGPPAMSDRTLAVGAPPPGGHDHGNGLPIGTYLGEFELTSTLGEGGFGIVYLATDHSLQRRVALKEYMPSSLAQRTFQSQVQVKSERYRETFEAGMKSFINEARLLASFDHPSLVKVYRFWEANGTAYMVMPFYEGRTLKDVLREMGKPPDEAWLRTLLAPLTEALATIHSEQCYHRDIAPDNVMMLAGSNRPLLLDFGAARRVIGDMTQALTVILKPGYAPVEQYAEIPGMKQGPWTDLYALAAVVYFAIVGKTPPPSVGRLLNDTYVPLAQAAAGRYGAAFLAAIDRALIVRPEARTQTIGQLRTELGFGELPSGDPYTTRPLPPGSAVPPRPRIAAPAPAAAPADAGSRRGALIGAGIGVVALAAVGVGAYSWLAAPPRPPAVAAAPAPAVVPTTAPPPASAAVVVAPAPAPAPVPVPPPAAPDLDPLHEIDRVVEAQSPGFRVQASAERPTVRIGKDEIAFDVTSEREGYLYVLAYDGSGGLIQLLPNTVSGTIKVRKGQRFRFPTGDGVVLPASDPPGPGELLVVVSARQRDHSELEPKKEGPMRSFPVGAEGGRILARHDGPQPLLVGRPICPATGACDADYGAAVIKVEVVR